MSHRVNWMTHNRSMAVNLVYQLILNILFLESRLCVEALSCHDIFSSKSTVDYFFLMIFCDVVISCEAQAELLLRPSRNQAGP